jgi:hypothetical protein
VNVEDEYLEEGEALGMTDLDDLLETQPPVPTRLRWSE